KQDDFTSSTTPTFGVKIGDMSSTAGDDASACWFWFTVPLSNNGLNFGPWPVTITGGAAAISRAIGFQLPVIDYLSQETASITPVLTSVWLKNISRQRLNTHL